jgi:Restriction endonuclease S subunits
VSADWPVADLGELCTVIAGQSPDGSSFNAIGDGLPFYQGKKDFTERYIGAPTVWTTEVTKEALAGDILMSVRAPVGPINYATQRACIGRGLAAIRPEAVDPDFLFYNLLSKQPEISGREGAVFASINRDDIQRIKVPLPNLAEQQRIVALLDKAFGEIALIESAYRTSLVRVEALGKVALRSILERGGDGWDDVILNEVAAVESGVGFPEALQGKLDEPLAFFKVGDMNTPGNEVDIRFPRHTVSEQTRAQLGARVFPVGSVIFPKVGGAIATNKKRLVARPCCVDNNVMGVIPDPRRLASELLYQLMLNKPLTDFSNDAGLPSIRKSTVEAWRFRMPADLAAQALLAERLAEIGAGVRDLAAVYERKLALLAELKQSFLARAFSGELTREPSAA